MCWKRNAFSPNHHVAVVDKIPYLVFAMLQVNTSPAETLQKVMDSWEELRPWLLEARGLERNSRELWQPYVYVCMKW